MAFELRHTPNQRLIVRNIGGDFSKILAKVREAKLNVFAVSNFREVISIDSISPSDNRSLTLMGAKVEFESYDVPMWASPF